MLWQILVLSLLGIILNVPLGMWRARLRRLSPMWFVAVHATVPLFAVLRRVMALNAWSVLAFILAAIAGQLLGGMLSRPEAGK